MWWVYYRRQGGVVIARFDSEPIDIIFDNTEDADGYIKLFLL